LRQHNYTVSASNQYKQGLLDSNSVDKIMSYNYGIEKPQKASFYGQNTSITSANPNTTLDLSVADSVLHDSITNLNTVVHSLENPTTQNSLGSTADSKTHTNPLKYVESSKAKTSSSSILSSDLQALNTVGLPYGSDDNVGNSFKFKDNKSTNMGFLSSEKNVRLIDNLNPSKLNSSLSEGNNNMEDIVSNSIGESIVPNTYNIYSSSKND
jgi:hypothetical protein